MKIGIIIITLALGVTQSQASNRDYQGLASWYSSGHRTASGDRFRPNALTVAHRTLPFGTKVQLTNPQNGSKITATVTDRGPFIKGRSFDVSRGVAQALGFIQQGVQRLVIRVVSR